MRWSAAGSAGEFSAHPDRRAQRLLRRLPRGPARPVRRRRRLGAHPAPDRRRAHDRHDAHRPRLRRCRRPRRSACRSTSSTTAQGSPGHSSSPPDRRQRAAVELCRDARAAAHRRHGGATRACSPSRWQPIAQGDDAPRAACARPRQGGRSTKCMETTHDHPPGMPRARRQATPIDPAAPMEVGRRPCAIARRCSLGAAHASTADGATSIRPSRSSLPDAHRPTAWNTGRSVSPERTSPPTRRRRASGAAQLRAGAGERARIAQALIDLGLSAERPGGDPVRQRPRAPLLMLGAMHAGVPYAPISPAYSLMSRDYGKLRHILNTLTPGLVRVRPGLRRGDRQRGGTATSSVVLTQGAVEGCARSPSRSGGDRSRRRGRRRRTPRSARHHRQVPVHLGFDRLPKGVINTQRMLCANQQQIRSASRRSATSRRC